MEKLILEKLEQSASGRERFVTTDLNVLKAVRRLGNQGLVQWKVKMQPAQPLGLTVHDDQLNTISDWAEKMVCQIIGAEQTAWNCKGHDGVLKSTGEKIEVKHVGWASSRNKNDQFSFRNLSLDLFDVLVAVHKDREKPNFFSSSKFYVLTNKDIEQNFYLSKKELKVFENQTNHKRLLQYECTLAELLELKHGYEHFLKMKGNVDPIEPPKESIQYVIDVWKPNKFNLMPYDGRYEASSWYGEFMVAQLFGGTVTEQRQSGFDVVVNGKRIEVKIAHIDAQGKLQAQNCLGNKDYDYICFVTWGFRKDDIDKNYLVDEAEFLFMTKEEAKRDAVNNSNRIDFQYKKTKHLKLIEKYGYDAEGIFELRKTIGSDDSNGNQIDLKPKFPIQFKSSKRTNQADQRSA